MIKACAFGSAEDIAATSIIAPEVDSTQYAPSATDASFKNGADSSVEQGTSAISPMLERALASEGAQKPFGTALSFLNWFNKNTLIKDLTPLQRKFEHHALIDDEASVFDRRRNVLLCGPTSSGKTTIADILIFQTVFANQGDNARANYLSPTKALAHEKHKALQEIFTGFSNSAFPASQILVSTGDDTKNDSKVVRGDFLIVSTVYEKANTLFSRNPSILNQVGLLVIDELHMFSDLERGPMLELIAAKAQSAGARARLRRVREEESLDAPRLLGISTDAALLESFITPFTREAGGRHLKPVIVDDQERPLNVTHTLFVPSDGGVELTSVRLGRTSDPGFPKIHEDRRGQILEECAKHLQTWKKEPGEKRASKEVIPTANDRTLNFLKCIIAERNKEKRFLVFVPSRSQAEDFAEKLFASYNGDEIGISDILKDGFSHVEDDGLRASLLKWAGKGIDVHHSESDSKFLSSFSCDEAC